jgi:hypothetical protein
MDDKFGREPGFLFNTKNLSFTLSVITLCGAIFGGFSKVNEYAYKIERIESDYRSLSEDSAKLTEKITSINGQLVELTVTLGRLEERVEVRIGNKK